jgi:hypothetical protein
MVASLKACQIPEQFSCFFGDILKMPDEKSAARPQKYGLLCSEQPQLG